MLLRLKKVSTFTYLPLDSIRQKTFRVYSSALLYQWMTKYRKLLRYSVFTYMSWHKAWQRTNLSKQSNLTKMESDRYMLKIVLIQGFGTWVEWEGQSSGHCHSPPIPSSSKMKLCCTVPNSTVVISISWDILPKHFTCPSRKQRIDLPVSICLIGKSARPRLLDRNFFIHCLQAGR